MPIRFDDIADLYDSYVRADFDIPFWLEEVRSSGGKALELACGTGRVSIPLLKAGVDLTCVDYSAGMLNQFRRKLNDSGLRCPIFCQDIAELDLSSRFDLVFIPFHSFSEIVDRQRQMLALQRIHSHLKENGMFICTLQNRAVRAASMDGLWHPLGEFPLENGERLAVSIRLGFSPSTGIASGEQKYERLSREDALLERRLLGVEFCLFEKSDFEELLLKTNFRVEAIYGDYQRGPYRDESSPYMILKAGRKSTERR